MLTVLKWIVLMVSVARLQFGMALTAPALRLRMMDNGFDKIAQVLTKSLNEKLPELEFEMPPAAKALGMTSPKVTEFEGVTVGLQPQPPNRILLTIEGGRVAFKSNFSANGGGEMRLTIADLDVKLGSAFGFNPVRGHLTHFGFTCLALVKTVDTEFIGNGSFVATLNGAAPLINGMIRAAFSQHICAASRQHMDTIMKAAAMGERPLMALPAPLHAYLLHYDVVAMPQATERLFQLDMNGEVSHRDASSVNTLYPFVRPRLFTPAPSEPRRSMVYAYATDYVVNTFFHHAHKQGLLTYTIDEESAAYPEVKQLLRLTCGAKEVCIGNVLKNVSQTFPNASAEVVLSSESRPHLTIANDVAKLNAEIGLAIAVPNLAERKKLVFIPVTIEAEFRVKVNTRVNASSMIAGDVKITQLKAGEIKILHPSIHREELQRFEGSLDAWRSVIEKKLNVYLEKGFDLEDILNRSGQFKVSQPTISMFDNTIELGLDIDDFDVSLDYLLKLAK